MKILIWFRSFLGVVVGVFFTLLMSLVTLAVAAFGNQNGVDWCLRFWARTCLSLFGVHVVVHGLENLPKDRGCLLLFNHQSHFDILCIKGYVPKRVRFGAKIELFKIPLFGAAMRAIGTLPIVRENRSEVFRVYNEASVKFRENWNFVLAPEGTRQPRPEIGPFKKGPFVFAVNAGAPVVPVVISGAYEVLSKDRVIPNPDRWTRTVHLRLLPPIETADKSIEHIRGMTEQMRSDMVVAFRDLRELQA